MSRTAVRVEGLSKRYRLGEREFKQNLGDLLHEGARKQFRRLADFIRQPRSRNADAAGELLWALKNVSFQVRQGEVIGIVGRNGAGKSTLLKILCRITDLTDGYVEIHGRIGSLLEVGTGFHSELTGRENIYLSGAVLGMRRAEITRKFDEIVAFSEIGKFLDTPVKRYSSGMYMRLAFAVAAHLEPEILIVDEVLAVGDAAFQKKCLGKMGDVASQGRTVLFVSHNMTAVQGLCDRVIWLQDGKIREDGSTGQVVSHYLQTTFSALTQQTWEAVERAPGNSWVRVQRVSVRPVNGSPSDPITVRTPFLIEFHYWSLQAGVNLVLSLHLYNEQGIIVFNVGADNSPNWCEQSLPAGLFQDVCHVPGDFLNDGMYRVELCVCKGQEVIFKLDDALIFEVHDSVELRGNWFGKWGGVVRPVLEWKSALLEADLPAATESRRSTL